MNTIVSPGWYTDALACKVTGPILTERGGVVGVASGVGRGLILTGVEGLATAVGGVVVLVELLVVYGPQPASNVRAATAPRVTSNRYIRFITDLLVTVCLGAVIGGAQVVDLANSDDLSLLNRGGI